MSSKFCRSQFLSYVNIGTHWQQKTIGVIIVLFKLTWQVQTHILPGWGLAKLACFSKHLSSMLIHSLQGIFTVIDTYDCQPIQPINMFLPNMAQWKNVRWKFLVLNLSYVPITYYYHKFRVSTDKIESIKSLLISECAADGDYCPTMQSTKEIEELPLLVHFKINCRWRWNSSRKI